MHLAGDDHRVDDAAEIVGRGEVDDRQMTGIGIDLDLGDIGSGRKGEILWVVERGLVEPRLQLLMREIVRHIGGQRDLAQTLRAVGAGDGELAVLELDIGLSGFQQMGGDLLALGDDLVHRLDERAAAHRQRARAVGAHTEGDLVRVAMHDLDRLDRDAEPVGDELGEGRLVSLAMRMRAGQDGHATGRVHPHRR